jgi:hypothetical protein
MPAKYLNVPVISIIAHIKLYYLFLTLSSRELVLFLVFFSTEALTQGIHLEPLYQSFL